MSIVFIETKNNWSSVCVCACACGEGRAWVCVGVFVPGCEKFSLFFTSSEFIWTQSWMRRLASWRRGNTLDKDKESTCVLIDLSMHLLFSLSGMEWLTELLRYFMRKCLCDCFVLHTFRSAFLSLCAYMLNGEKFLGTGHFITKWIALSSPLVGV